jgi:glycosyltransferase involved in cell wall biosynthesis
MKIFVTGTRGIPDIPGGVEKHCQELYPLIASKGHEIVLATRRPYVTKKISQYKLVSLWHGFAPRKKSLEAIVHTFFAVIKARKIKSDIIHIHAVGPGLMVPFARLLGLKVVVTNHGPDYDRQKWGRTAKFILRLGEWAGGTFANEVIVISRVIGSIIGKRCRRLSHLIYNGVPLPVVSENYDYLASIGVAPGRYILAVARFVPEKGLDLLVQAFKGIPGDMKLVIAGDADHESGYSLALRRMMAEDPRIVATGYITGDPLRQIYSHARLFVLPSYHEGLPIALLEAMSYGLSVLVSDIPANKEVELQSDRYFVCGDVLDLGKKLELFCQQDISEDEKRKMRSLILHRYNWDKIAEQTLYVYRAVLKK